MTIGNVERARLSGAQPRWSDNPVGESGTTPAVHTANPAAATVATTSAIAQRARRAGSCSRHTIAPTTTAVIAAIALVSRVAIHSAVTPNRSPASHTIERRRSGTSRATHASPIATAVTSAANESLMDSDKISLVNPRRIGSSKNANVTATAATRARWRRTASTRTAPSEHQAMTANHSWNRWIASPSTPSARYTTGTTTGLG